jgi:hypothetical protein
MSFNTTVLSLHLSSGTSTNKHPRDTSVHLKVAMAVQITVAAVTSRVTWTTKRGARRESGRHPWVPAAFFATTAATGAASSARYCLAPYQRRLSCGSRATRSSVVRTFHLDRFHFNLSRELRYQLTACSLSLPFRSSDTAQVPCQLTPFRSHNTPRS